MKVLYDSQIFNGQRYGGISRYFVRLFQNIIELEDASASVLAPFFINQYLSEVRHNGGISGLPLSENLKPFSKAISHIASHFLVPFKDIDIIHKTYFYPERYVLGKKKSVLTVYDMIHELYPQNFSESDKTSKYKYEAVMKADHVICISENTRSDLLRIWDCDPNKVSVVHLGFDSFQGTSRVKKENFAERQSGDYILFVGSRSGHKNFLNLLKAFGSADALNRDFNLVCFGGGPLNDDEIAVISKLGLHGHVCQVGGDDCTLGDLYRGASLFVYPSVYEGFGIPPLEAMSVGCPVACANSSSIPEVCGKAVDYFDPLDINSIASSLTRVLGDSKYSESLAAAGIAQAENFSWHKCAVDTLKCYQVTSDSQRAS